MLDDVRSEMPGCVLTVVADVGDRVTDGQVLLLLESMKMEIPVVAEREGVLVQCAVAAGDVVRSGDLLVQLRAE